MSDPIETTDAQEPAGGPGRADVPDALGKDVGVRPEAAVPKPDYYDQLLKLKAEFENFRKRTDREKPELYRLGRAELLLKFLPIYDLLGRAHEEVQAAHLNTPLAHGMEGIFKEFEKIFKEEGAAKMDPAGKPFDALLHEVVGTVETDKAPEGCVIGVLQPGFMIGDKVLRTAKVRIAIKPACGTEHDHDPT